MTPRTRLCAALCLVLAACVHDPYDDAREKDTPDAYQQFLRAHPAEHGSSEAHARLAQLRFAEARQAHTVLGYKRFLEDFPDSEEAPDALKLLESLRFAAAQSVGSAQAWRDFLRDHPDGAHATQARTALDDVSWKQAQASTTAAAMREYLAHFPESVHRAEAERVVDDRAYAESRAAGNKGLLDYLEHSPNGAHRDEARGQLSAQEAEALADGGDLAGAYALAERVHGPEAEPLMQRLAQRELAEVAAALDPTALRQLASRRPQVATAANELAKKIEHDGKTKALRAQLAHLDPLEFGRPPEELVRALDAPDPRDRWLAAEELGALGAQSAYEKLVDVAADARFEELRLRAFAALQQLVARTGKDAAAVDARSRLEKLRRMASSPRMYLKIAIVEELAGMRVEALADYQRCLRGDAADLLALRRLLELEPPGFERAVAARRLAVTVIDEITAHTSAEGDPPLLASRWLCGVAHDADAAQTALAKLPETVAKDAPEDMSAFRARAREAQAQAHARLSDAEDAARAEQRTHVACEADDVLPRIQDGVKARLAAVAALAAAKSELAQYPLRQVARRDPSAEVRQAALQALAPPNTPISRR
ncbi:MAG: hypothetical protein JST54_04440 [Deltaproteobacteria bacterium]|nr:hypothetical protein [Deltaproteobacteria bacterium]